MSIVCKYMDTVTIFFGGDICGTLGFKTALDVIPALIKDEKLDFVAVNGENAADGCGVDAGQAELLFAAGVDVITGGNHSLERFDVRETFGKNPRILCPANYPSRIENGYVTLEKPHGRFTVINVQGREGMRPIDCPFQTVDRLLEHTPAGIAIVDFHAESVQEKEALAYYLDGRVSCVFGSHTHTQTTDERILAGGTGYLTDAGMIGSYHSVIGGRAESSVVRSLTLVPQPFVLETYGTAIFCGVIAVVSADTYRTHSLKRIYRIIDLEQKMS
ncbi:MAG: TIGR00282 family metallophosphoesterase [Treponema sp.]